MFLRIKNKKLVWFFFVTSVFFDLNKTCSIYLVGCLFGEEESQSAKQWKEHIDMSMARKKKNKWKAKRRRQHKRTN